MIPLRPKVFGALDRKRLRTRGFNQAELLSVTRLCVWPLKKAATLADHPQADLDEKDRWLNVAGAFAAGGDLAGKEILLVDDIYARATAEAASQAWLKPERSEYISATVAVASSHPQGRANKY